ncbi:Envelope glycoprotein I [Cacatuid alphaherpesvirus 2]|uniref:Envelope glycoprotein I n=1 Tax=Cacatuid alphaherpesvirus 2 TaxID=2604840 RepID=A0A5B9R003_9ALPH|nr:Envelope glycoprotein I [Cacatuid alphaherpesvirus 2]QEG54081.1 Envelope glycoprotein I [Cacatuid alphaherpesvirus 2]
MGCVAVYVISFACCLLISRCYGIIVKGSFVSGVFEENIVVLGGGDQKIGARLLFLGPQRPLKPYGGGLRVFYQASNSPGCFQKVFQQTFENCTFSSPTVFTGCMNVSTKTSVSWISRSNEPGQVILRSPTTYDSGSFYFAVLLDYGSHPDAFKVKFNSLYVDPLSSSSNLARQDSLCQPCVDNCSHLRDYLRTIDSWTALSSDTLANNIFQTTPEAVTLDASTFFTIEDVPSDFSNESLETTDQPNVTNATDSHAPSYYVLTLSRTTIFITVGVVSGLALAIVCSSVCMWFFLKRRRRRRERDNRASEDDVALEKMLPKHEVDRAPSPNLPSDVMELAELVNGESNPQPSLPTHNKEI